MSRLLTLLLVPALLLAGCGTAPNAVPAAAPAVAPLVVAASFYPLAFLAERVGGAYATVITVTPAGAEPHDYEPTPREIAAIYNSQILLFHGAGLDSWATRLAPELTAKKVAAIEMTAGLPLRASAEDAAARDPHVWLDPILLSTMTDKVRDIFVTTDPAHAADYTANATVLHADLAALDAEFRATLTPACRLHAVIVSHDAFEYLGARYGVEMLPIAGISPEAEPSPARLAELAQLARAKGIKYVTFEALVSPKVAETLAAEVGAQTLVLNPIEGLTDGERAAGMDLLALMRANLQNLMTALECPAR